MIREQWFQRLVDDSPVDYYACGVDGARVCWPWRMLKAEAEADQKHGEACDHYVVDSNFKDPSVTNEDALDDAVEYNADVAALADVLGDSRATVDAIVDGLELFDDHEFDGTVLLPLQAPHDQCYRQIEASISDRDDIWWGLGGLKDAPASAKVRAARGLRQVAGRDVHIHGLGFGPTDELCAALRKDEWLLDSIDSSTAMADANNMPVMSGDERMSTVASFAQAFRIEYLRKLSGHADAEALAPATHHQSGMEAFAIDD